MKADLKKIDHLTEKLSSGELSDAERIELNELLQADPRARKRYLQWVRLNSGLRDHYSGGTSILLNHEADDDKIVPISGWKKFSLPLAAAACLLFSLSAVMYFTDNGDDSQTTTGIEMPNAAWAWLEYRDNMEIEGSNSAARQIGMPLYDQTFRIDDGQASIRFCSGTQLALVGPAEIHITGSNAAMLVKGSASIRIVEGSEGFELETPSGMITDLGTAFGVYVDAAGRDEVHVLDGKVRIETNQGNHLRELVAGEADQVGENSEFTLFRPESFPVLSIDGELNRMVKTTWLDELDTRYIQQEWGNIGINESVDSSPLSVAGVSYRRGLGTHAHSQALYQLPEGVLRFRALVGIDDEVDEDLGGGAPPSCIFHILGDGKELWVSPTMWTKTPAERIDLDIRGVKELRLVVDNAGNGNDWDHANWLEASFVHTGSAPTPRIWTNDYSQYILTPEAGPAPRINGAKVVGATPGKPFLFRIPTSGKRPITFTADNLPEGITLDADKGILRGQVPEKGDYVISLSAGNAHGETNSTLKLVSGDTLALTPPMGWNSWMCWSESISQAKVLAAAKAIESSGLADYGWTYVNIDDCWQGQRGGDYQAIQGNARFPNIKSLCNDIHNMGLKVGIFSSPWMGSPAGFIGGSSKHPSGSSVELYIPAKDRIQTSQIYGRWPSVKNLELNQIGCHWFNDKDAQQWSDWGIDYAKYTWFNDRANTAQRLQNDLTHTSRDIVISFSNHSIFHAPEKTSPKSNLWRIAFDNNNTWPSVLQNGFQTSAKTTTWASRSQPGSWADLDILQLGAFGVPNDYVRTLRNTRLSPHEQYSHMSLWCLRSSPLMLSCDIKNLDLFTLSLLKNSEVIAINQDPLGKTAMPVDGNKELWLKPLEDGSYAVGIFNLSDKKQTKSVNWSQLNLPEGLWNVRDLWRQKNLGQYPTTFTTEVEPHGVTLIKLTPSK